MKQVKSHLTYKNALELLNTVNFGTPAHDGGLNHPAHLNKQEFSWTHMKATERARTGRTFKSPLDVLLFHSFVYEHDFQVIH